MIPADVDRRSALDAVAARRLRRDGPTLDVVLHTTCRDGSACPPVHGRAMVDTGADRTAVSMDAVRGARPSGSFRALGVTSGEVDLPIYPVRLGFPGTGLPEVAVPEAAGSPHLRDQGIDVLIGREVLGRGRLVYDGRTGRWSLSIDEAEPAQPEPRARPAGVLALAPVAASIILAALVLASR